MLLTEKSVNTNVQKGKNWKPYLFLVLMSPPCNQLGVPEPEGTEAESTNCMLDPVGSWHISVKGAVAASSAIVQPIDQRSADTP